MYPHSKVVARKRGGGIALFSRFPLAQCEVVSLGHDERPAIKARIPFDGTLVSFFTFHTHAPLRRDHYRYRNQQLAAAADLIRTLPAPAIVIGDFNSTTWSPYFRQLIEVTGLVNARQGFGLLPTWPAWLLLPVLMLPIDHCLVTADILVDNIRTGRRMGSDHLPLIVDLAIPAAEE
jgi:endonuclease/exonuclease/phosphatase (EEP) superfamily protein YafD